MLLGEFATPESLAALEAKLGLDRPAYVQYLDWMGGVLRGDLGVSLRTDCRSRRRCSRRWDGP